VFFFSSRRRHTRWPRDWSSDVCSSDLPAAFATTYPALGVLNIMHLATPESAILSAVIFNALIIIALIPLALKGVRYRPLGAGLEIGRASCRERGERRESGWSSEKTMLV